MTDDDRPTLPGTIDAAGSDREDVHDRDTIPAPEPEPASSQEPARDSAPTQPVALRLATGQGAGGEGEPRAPTERDVDTWRPPPAPRAAAEKTAAPSPGQDAASSLAPREMAQRTSPPERGQRRLVGFAAIAVLLGLGVIAVQRADRDARERAAASGAAAATSAQAAAPEPREPLQRSSSPAATAPAAAAAPAIAAAGARGETSASEPVAERAAAGLAAGAAPPLALAARADRAGQATGAGARRRAARAHARPAAELPETPTRESIAMSLQDLRDAIQMCSAGRNGVAELDLTIRGNGMLAHALVGGDFAGTPQGSCIARTLRKARFAPFEREKFRVLYRLML